MKTIRIVHYIGLINVVDTTKKKYKAYLFDALLEVEVAVEFENSSSVSSASVENSKLDRLIVGYKYINNLKKVL